jgi:hypothetical protein
VLRRNIITFIAVIILVAAAPAVTFAQQQGPRIQMGSGAKGGGMERFAKVLGLEGEELELFVAMGERFREEKRMIGSELRTLMSRLEDELKNKDNDKAIQEILDQIESVHKKADSLRKAEREEIKKLLTPRQLALLLTRFGRGPRAGMRPGGPGPAGGARGPAPGGRMGPGPGGRTQQGMPGGPGR